MNDFHIYDNKYSKLSLYKNNNKKKMRNLPPSLKNIFYINQNALEISSQYSNYQNSQNKKFDENSKYKHITYNNSNNNKNLSFPINATSSNKNNKSIKRDGSLNSQNNILLKKKIDKFYSKKIENSNKHNSKENTYNMTNINQFKNMNGIIPNKHNINIYLPRKSNIKFFSLKENNISLNSNNFIGKSMSKEKSQSKSKSNSKNKQENKNYNIKVNSNINKVIIDNYLKLYKNGEKNISKKNTRNKLNFLYKEYPRNNSNKFSNEKYKMSPKNILNNLKYKGLKRKNKSSNLLITNFNKSKNNSNSKKCIASKKESNNKLRNKNNKIDGNINKKKILEEGLIMNLINKKQNIKKNNNKNKKDKKISPKQNKNNKNKIISIIITKAFNNNNNKNSNKYLNEKNQNKESNDNMQREGNKEVIIYDYSKNNIFNGKIKHSNEMNSNANGSKKNLIINTQYDNDENLYKLIDERLKTEYNDNSLEAIDKMFEEENEEEMTKKSKSLSKRESYKFLYPEIYMKDDEYYVENDNNNSNDKREKELDETESPLKVDTYKEDIENSGILSFDQVKDIICYYNLNSRNKQNDFLFKKNDREIYDINSKNKYLNFFFENNINLENSKDKKNSNENNYEINNNNFKYPNNSIFSIDTDYSSKMKKKYNKNLVKNI